jgi:hypothetical protein
VKIAKWLRFITAVTYAQDLLIIFLCVLGALGGSESVVTVVFANAPAFSNTKGGP